MSQHEYLNANEVFLLLDELIKNLKEYSEITLQEISPLAVIRELTAIKSKLALLVDVAGNPDVG